MNRLNPFDLYRKFVRNIPEWGDRFKEHFDRHSPVYFLALAGADALYSVAALENRIPVYPVYNGAIAVICAGIGASIQQRKLSIAECERKQEELSRAKPPKLGSYPTEPFCDEAF